jgi:hypothetical protein
MNSALEKHFSYINNKEHVLLTMFTNNPEGNYIVIGIAHVIAHINSSFLLEGSPHRLSYFVQPEEEPQGVFSLYITHNMTGFTPDDIKSLVSFFSFKLISKTIEIISLSAKKKE